VRAFDEDMALTWEFFNQRGYAADIAAVRRLRAQMQTFADWLAALVDRATDWRRHLVDGAAAAASSTVPQVGSGRAMTSSKQADSEPHPDARAGHPYGRPGPARSRGHLLA
jgi:hypothetical protein